MIRYLLCLALGTFAVGTGTYAFLGVIDPLAADLGVTLAAAGQVATVFALTYALSSPFLVTLTGRAGRRPLLVAALLLFALANAAAALAPDYGFLLAARVLGAAAAALYMPIATATAGGLAPAEKRGAALAAVTSGLIVAFMAGIPAGTVLGDAFGWRATFWLSGALALVAAAAVRAGVPAVPAPPPLGLRALRVAAHPVVARVLALTVLGFAAMFVVVGYVAPLLEAMTGLSGRAIGLIQSAVGVGSLVGAAAGGVAADRGAPPRALAALLAVLAVGMVPYSLIVAFGTPGSTLNLVAAVAALLVGNAALFALVPLQQYRLLRAVPEEANTALAVNASAIFLGQGLGAALGGVAIATWGIGSLGWVGAGCALLGLGVLAGWGSAGESLPTAKPAPARAPAAATLIRR